eukprot:CAMPEP_0167802964 /NCGR_PEP_ID=MMETSP0111_2-20121227/19478_1 /TAXON_ID=91324 /ORGANISM="Lotharella globosa, Strain CCCM811" /LENGTH=123 /DNA_ID=CAMNT_0007699191 /DNA_START=30 /DNA_END=401 /DNA_ORIENTATION=-
MLTSHMQHTPLGNEHEPDGPVSPMDNEMGDDLDPLQHTPLQNVFRFRSNLFFVLFWVVLFAMTNFVYFYFSLKDFAFSVTAWYITIGVFVCALACTYLLHTWYDCLAYAAVVSEGSSGAKSDI